MISVQAVAILTICVWAANAPTARAFYFPCDTLLARYDAGRHPAPTPDLNATFPRTMLSSITSVGVVPGASGGYNGFRIHAHTASFEKVLDEDTLLAAIHTGWELRLRMQILGSGSKDTFVVLDTFDGKRLIIFWNFVTTESALIKFDFAETGNVTGPGNDGLFHEYVLRGHPSPDNSTSFDFWIDGKHHGEFAVDGVVAGGQFAPFGIAVGSSSGVGHAIWNHIAFSSGCAAATVAGVPKDTRFDHGVAQTDSISIEEPLSSVIFDAPIGAVRLGAIESDGVPALSIVAPGGFFVDGIDIEEALTAISGASVTTVPNTEPSTVAQVQLEPGVGLAWSGSGASSTLYASANSSLVLDGQLVVQGMNVGQTLREFLPGLPSSPPTLGSGLYGIDIVSAEGAVRFPTSVTAVHADLFAQEFSTEQIARGSPSTALSVDRKLYVNGIDVYESVYGTF